MCVPAPVLLNFATSQITNSDSTVRIFIDGSLTGRTVPDQPVEQETKYATLQVKPGEAWSSPFVHVSIADY